MARSNSEKPLLLQRFSVKGYKNLTSTVELGPLGLINVIHGDNNVGKSNVLQAMDLCFRLLGELEGRTRKNFGASVSQSDLVGWGYPSRGRDLFNLAEIQPIEMTATFSVAPMQLRNLGIVEGPELCVAIRVEPRRKGDYGDLMVSLTDMTQAAQADLQRVSQFLSQASQHGDEIYSRFALLRVDRRLVRDQPTTLDIVPQKLRDALFDAKESQNLSQVHRWQLFVDAMKQFKSVLGPGQFHTSFDRQQGKANLVFESTDMRVPVDLLGTGVQQIVALLGQLLMTPATFVGIEEPELNLRYTLQKQLLKAFRRIAASEHGPQQFFLTSHSTAFEAEETFFAMEIKKGTPVLKARPRAEARLFTGMREEEDLYAQMHAGQPEPPAYVSSEGLVMLPDRVRQTLGIESGGGVGFIRNEETGRFEIWSLDEIKDYMAGGSGDDDAA